MIYLHSTSRASKCDQYSLRSIKSLNYFNSLGVTSVRRFSLSVWSSRCLGVPEMIYCMLFMRSIDEIFNEIQYLLRYFNDLRYAKVMNN